MAGGAKFPDKGTSAIHRILRVSRADAYCKYSEKPDELHGIIFCKSGAPEGIRTPDPQIRSLMLSKFFINQKQSGEFSELE